MILLTAMALLLSAPENFDRVWTFAEAPLEDWVIQEGRWEFQDGQLRHDDRHFKGGLITLPEMHFSEVTVEAALRITELYHDKESVWAGVLVRASDPLGKGAWQDGYLAVIRANGQVVLHSPTFGELATASCAIKPTDESLRLRVSARGSTLELSINDDVLITTQHTAHKQGQIAVLNYGNVATFDKVRVQGIPLKPTAPGKIVAAQPVPKSSPKITPLPRIATRKTVEGVYEFYQRESGEAFLPRGFNHTVLEFGATGWHATFNVGIYQPESMEKLLTEMEALGANAIRVWIWGTQNESGFTGARGLQGAYMENVVDFLTRCTRHGIYVIPVMDEAPKNAYYDNLAARIDFGKDLRKVTGYNRQFLTEGLIQAKAQAARDFVGYIKTANPDLLPTVLGWSLSNEVCVNTSEGPFRANSGELLLPNGKSYSMADAATRQQCYDEGILYWSNTIAKVIKTVDPEGMVTAGMWTSDAHGRQPINGLPHDGKDPRIPPRPAVLGGKESLLDFLDVHIYPWDGTSKVNGDCHERDQVVMPALIGEYGVFKSRNTIEEARIMLKEMLDQGYALGYRGDLHWVWDLTLVEGQTWGAVEEGLGGYVMGLSYSDY